MFGKPKDRFVVWEDGGGVVELREERRAVHYLEAREYSRKARAFLADATASGRPVNQVLLNTWAETEANLLAASYGAERRQPRATELIGVERVL